MKDLICTLVLIQEESMAKNVSFELEGCFKSTFEFEFQAPVLPRDTRMTLRLGATAFIGTFCLILKQDNNVPAMADICCWSNRQRSQINQSFYLVCLSTLTNFSCNWYFMHQSRILCLEQKSVFYFQRIAFKVVWWSINYQSGLPQIF